MRKLVLGVLVVAVAVGASVGVVLGSGSTSAIKASAGSGALQMHRVDAPSTKLAGITAQRRRHRAKVIYLETAPFTLQGDETQAARGPCPRRARAISGYFGEDGETAFPVFDSVGNSPRTWLIAIHNGETAPVNAFLGTVCLKP
jgi:hypothetical protein